MAALLYGLPASAFDLDIRVNSSSETARETLPAASLLATSQEALSDPRDILATANAEYGQMVTALYSLGFYGGTVSIKADGREVSDIAPLAVPERIDRVVIEVDSGPRFRFSDAVVDPIAPDTALPSGFATGKTARADLVREAASTAVEAWREAGHAKADLTDESLRADHATSRLSAVLRIVPGPRLTFGKVNVVSDSAVRAGAIRRIAGVPVGETFSPEELRIAAQRLRRTGAFRSVTLREAEEIGPGTTLATEVEVVDAKPRRFGFGAELSSLEGLTLSGFWMHRNLTGAADRLRLEAETRGIGGDSGGIDYRLGLDYRYPAVYGADTDAFLSADLEVLDEPEYLSEQADLTIGATRILSENLTAELAVGYRYSFVHDAFGDREFQILSLPAKLTWDTRDDLLNPTEGHYLLTGFSPFYETVRDNAGLRFTADGRLYQSFGERKRTILAGRLQLGTVAGPSLSEIPPDYLFFSGGGGTVRGQPYQSLTIPRDGNDSGGQSFAGLSVEARQAVGKSFQVVAFADAGWISDEDQWQGDAFSHAGAGLGVRYLTSFGPIRFDVAGPVSGDTGDGIQIYIGIGQAF